MIILVSSSSCWILMRLSASRGFWYLSIICFSVAVYAGPAVAHVLACDDLSLFLSIIKLCNRKGDSMVKIDIAHISPQTKSDAANTSFQHKLSAAASD